MVGEIQRYGGTYDYSTAGHTPPPRRRTNFRPVSPDGEGEARALAGRVTPSNSNGDPRGTAIMLIVIAFLLPPAAPLLLPLGLLMLCCAGRPHPEGVQELREIGGRTYVGAPEDLDKLERDSSCTIS